MRATPEKVLRRVRGVIGTTGNETSSAVVARLVLRRLLFDGEPAPMWRNEAACTGLAPDVFYPPPGQADAAKRVCRGCPVRTPCLVDVLGWESSGRRHGVVGGLTPTERDRLVAGYRREANGGTAA
jgi:WhiB family redox-sensing transcriptional regulator